MKCQICNHKIKHERDFHFLDDLVVCEACYENSIDMDGNKEPDEEEMEKE